MQVSISLESGRKVVRLLLIGCLLLILMSIIGQVCRFSLGYTTMHGFIPMFYVDDEMNIPTWYSSILWLVAGAVLGCIAFAKRFQSDRFQFHWLFLSILCVGLSMDEVVGIHEYPIERLRTTFNADGLLYFTWVVPGIVFVGAIGIFLLKFLRALPVRTRNLFVLAGAIFVGGAIGVEMISGYQVSRFGEENFAYAAIVTLEESMEMLGVILFIYASLEYLSRTVGEMRIQLPETGLGKLDVGALTDDCAIG